MEITQADKALAAGFAGELEPTKGRAYVIRRSQRRRNGVRWTAGLYGWR